MNDLTMVEIESASARQRPVTDHETRLRHRAKIEGQGSCLSSFWKMIKTAIAVGANLRQIRRADHRSRRHDSRCPGGFSPDTQYRNSDVSKGRQDNIDRLMFAHFKTVPATFPVTPESHEKRGL